MAEVSASLPSSQISEELIQRDLFGGYCSAVLPRRFIDVSDFRQVPDNQEVYTDAETDQSIIIEFVELDDSIAPGELAQYHFQELADVGGSAASEIIRVGSLSDSETPNMPPGEAKVYCVGHQQISKAKETALNSVRIYLAALRCPAVETEILITFYTPIAIDPLSSSAGAQVLDPDYSAGIFLQVLRSFHVRDWALFG